MKLKIIDSPFQDTCATNLNINFNESIILLDKSKLKSFGLIVYFYFLHIKKKKKLLVVGDLRSYSQLLAVNLFKPEEVLVVDDGTYSLVLFKSLCSNEFTGSKLKNYLIKKTISNIQNNSRLTFKTIFHDSKNSKMAQKKGFNIHPNKLNFNKNLKQKINPTKAIFIGQDLVELKIMKRNNYHQVIKIIYNRMAKLGIDFYYYPHRAENANNLKDLSLEIKNCKILERSLPIEDYLLYLDDLPAHIFTFYSTAIYAISRIFVDINCAVLYADECYINYLDSVETSYDLFKDDEEVDFESININD